MIPNQAPEAFLEQHLGHQWNPVSYDELEYGMLGEPILILPASGKREANGYQSQILSDAVATQIGDALKDLGIDNPRDYTRVETGNGVTLLFTSAGARTAMQNSALIDATATTPLIGETGMRSFVARTRSPEDGLEYLNTTLRDIDPNATWRKMGSTYSLMDVDTQTMLTVREALTQSGVTSHYSPAGNDDVASGDAFPAREELRVNARDLQHTLGKGNDGAAIG